MKAQIAEVRCRETGSELIALLLESHEIKKHKPLYNRAQKRTHHPYSVYTFYDLNGYIRFQPGKNLQGMQELVQLANAEAAKIMLFRAVEEWKLCQKLCGLYKTQGACFHFSLKQCNGACMQKETAEDYNNRAMAFIRKLSFSGESFFIIDEGVTDEECSVIQIENGRYKGFGTLHRDELNESEKALSGCISSYAHNKDTQHILKSYLLQNPQLTIIKY